MRALWIAFITVGIVSSNYFSREATGAAADLKTTPQRIVVFKNGLGFVVRSGEAELKDGVAELEPLPSAALGALWFAVENPAHRITEVTTVRREEKVSVPAVNLFELMRANIGKKARISYIAGGTEAHVEANAEILAVPDERVAEGRTGAELADYISARPRWVPPGSTEPAARGELVIFRTSDNGILALPRHAIQSVRLLDANLNTEIRKEIVRTRLRFEGPPEKANVNVMYLQKGWNWSPSYLIDLADEKEANLTLEAVLANDIEDIEGAEVSFVAGYPNFAFADIAHPLSSPQTIGELVQALLSHNEGRGRGRNFGIMMQNAVAYSDATASAAYSASDLADDSGQASEDLYFFRQPAVSLARGGRARFTLINLKVPYEHIYEWRLGEKPQNDQYGQPERALPGKENEVWHTIRLTNSGKQPWTTAPAMAVNGQVPIAQDTLKYTPAGASSSVRVTVASDIRANEMSTEVSRAPVSIHGYNAMKVSLKNELTVHNFKKTPVKMAIHRTIQGEAGDRHTATMTRSGRDLSALNPTQTLKWEFELGAGEEKKFEFNYTTITTR
jgi:hypothetical protein